MTTSNGPVKGKGDGIYIWRLHCNTLIALRYGSHSVTRKLHTIPASTSLAFTNGATTDCGSGHLIAAYFSFIDPEG